MKIAMRFSMVLLLAISSVCFSDEKQQIVSIIQDRVDTYRSTAGMVIGVIDKAGPRVYSYGHLCLKCERAVDGDTIFEIGSISKVFTALLLEQMVEQGKMKLEDPISLYLPKSVKTPVRKGKEITLIDLATQSSGLPRLPDNLKPADPTNPYADYTVQNLYDFLSGYTLTRDIGSQYEYSNLGMGLLGHLITLKAKQDYESLVKERICKPLKMESTTVQLTPQMKERLATPYSSLLQPVSNWDIPALAGAGALRSTANDLLIFVGANLGLIPSSLHPAMEQTQKPLRMGASIAVQLGLAWHIVSMNGSNIVLHDGGTGGYRSIIAFDKAAQKGIVVLSNSENDVNDIALHLLNDKFELAKLEKPKGHVVAPVDSSVLEKYAGTYQSEKGKIQVIKENDSLFLQREGKNRVRIFPESPTDFFAKLFDLQAHFALDASGNVASLTVIQDGVSSEYSPQSHKVLP